MYLICLSNWKYTLLSSIFLDTKTCLLTIDTRKHRKVKHEIENTKVKLQKLKKVYWKVKTISKREKKPVKALQMVYYIPVLEVYAIKKQFDWY